MTNIKRRKQGSSMNGDHGRIFDKINTLEVAVAEIKKDTGFIRDTLKDHIKEYKTSGVDVTKRIRILEAWRWRMVGGLIVVSSCLGFFAFIKTIGVW